MFRPRRHSRSAPNNCTATADPSLTRRGNMRQLRNIMAKVRECVRRGKSSRERKMKDGQPQQSIPESKHLAGDGVRLKMPVNRESLWIEGDGCSVEIQVNHGLVRVTGDGCRVRIERNLGRVDYVGDGGRVYLGLGCDADTVTYRGDGGIVEAGNKGRVAAGARRSRVVRNGRLVVTEVKANETTGDECLRIQTGVKPGARISINLNGVNGKCVNVHGTTC